MAVTIIQQPTATPVCKCGQAYKQSLTLLRNGGIQEGDICSIQASIFAPFLTLLRIKEGENRTSWVSKRFEEMSVKTLSGDAGKPRPGVVTGTEEQDDRVKVFLMATFEGSKEPPKVFSPFMVPVSTKGSAGSKALPEKEPHLHTSPEWPSSLCQWITTLPHEMDLSESEGRWECNSTNRTGYHLSESEIIELMVIGEDQLKRFRLDARQPGFKKWYRKQLLDEQKVTHFDFVSVLQTVHS